MPEKDVLDVNELLNQLGGTFKSVGADGSVNFETMDAQGKPVVQNLDISSLAKSQGLDLNKLDIQYNSPETASDENAVGFKDAVEMAFARRPADKQRILEEKFGANNVVATDEGEFKVRQNGVWKKAEDGFLASLTADAPVTAAGIAGFAGGAKAGAALGGAVGTMVAPGIGTAAGAGIGGFIGGVLGGATSATLARYGQIEAAEALGIRSEADADEVQKELGKEFADSVIWDVALAGGGKIAKAGFKVGKGALKKAFDVFADKETTAAALETMMKGTSKLDWETTLRSVDDAKEVRRYMEMNIAHKAAELAGKAKRAIDPATAMMVRVAKGSMQTFRRAAQGSYDTMVKTLDEQGILKAAKVNIEGAYGTFHNKLADLGLIDGLGNVIKKPGEAAEQILQVFDPKSRRTLQMVHAQMRRVISSKGKYQMNFQDAQKLLRGIDDILESTGHYKGGDAAISNQARLALKELRKGLRNSLGEGLGDQMVKVGDQRMTARAFFDQGTAKYAKFREVYDDFAIPHSLGGDAAQVESTVRRMLGDRGFALEEKFGALAEVAGKDGQKILNKLKQLRAAKNLSDVYSPSAAGLSAIIKRTIMPVGHSPRDTLRYIADNADTIVSKTPASQQSLTRLKYMGRMVDFMRKMTPEDRLKLMSNPEMYRGLWNATMSAPDQEAAMTQELMSSATGGQ